MDKLEDKNQEMELALTDISPDNMIDFVQKQRIRLLMDEELSDKYRVAVLNGIAQTAVSIKRITTDDKNASLDRDVNQAIASALKNMPNPFLIPNGRPAHERVTAPDLPEITLVPDETSTAIATFELEDIIQQ